MIGQTPKADARLPGRLLGVRGLVGGVTKMSSSSPISMMKSPLLSMTDKDSAVEPMSVLFESVWRVLDILLCLKNTYMLNVRLSMTAATRPRWAGSISSTVHMLLEGWAIVDR